MGIPKSHVIAVFLVIISVFGVGCRKLSPLNSAGSELQSYASDWMVKLRDGSEINSNKYTLSKEVSSEVQNLIDSTLSAYADQFKTKLGNNASELTFPEAFATYLYTRWYYDEFAKYLANKKDQEYRFMLQERQVEALFLAVISAVNKLPKHKGRVFFGALLPENWGKQQFEPGKIYIQENFTSMSRNIVTAEIFAKIETRLEVPGNASFLFEVVESTTGVDISRIGFEHEAEILFPPKRPFTVKSISKVREAFVEYGAKYSSVYKVVLEES
jgi:hypothetical protein